MALTQDLWNIGTAIGLEGFDDSHDHELNTMNAALARAKREDKKSMRSTDNEVLNQQMGAYLEGKVEQEGLETQTQYWSGWWLTKIREKYEGAVIRRTALSTDYEGESINGLEPYDEHLCVLDMYEHEYEALERHAERAVDSESFVRRFASEVSQRILVESELTRACGGT
jgi:hypothetical protein